MTSGERLQPEQRGCVSQNIFPVLAPREKLYPRMRMKIIRGNRDKNCSEWQPDQTQVHAMRSRPPVLERGGLGFEDVLEFVGVDRSAMGGAHPTVATRSH